MNFSRPIIRRTKFFQQIRRFTSLPTYINTYPSQHSPNSHILTLLRTPNPSLSLGTTTALPPTPSSFTPNPSFLPILHSVLRTHASQDPNVQAQAVTVASSAGSSSTSTRSGRHSSGAGPSSSQGGSGGGGRGGWIHVSDLRRPPDWGRIADPEDIFGSVEVDGRGEFVEPGGNYQESGTYRLLTPDGM